MTTGPATSPPTRRTQRQRREATIARLVQATIDAIVEVGHARASVNEICERAQVSHGGLFRHFDTREDLLVAATAEVARRQLAAAQDQLAAISLADEEDFVSAATVIRDLIREPSNAVFHELFVAARTNESLAAKLRPACQQYYEQIYALAVGTLDPHRAAPSDAGAGPAHPNLADATGRDYKLAVVLSAAMLMFDGEAVGRVIDADPRLETDRLSWMANAAYAALGTAH